MALPQQFLDELIARTDITELVSRYVPLKKKGNNFWACCPFHHEKTPSFSVSQDKQFFKCFGCGEGGNAVHFLMKIENLPYIDAVRKLADMAGMELPQEDDGGRGRLQRRRLLELNRAAARYFYDTLMGEAGQEARAYLEKRGIMRQTAVRFGLGYADQSWDGLIHAMRAKGFTEQELEEARLAGRSKRGSLYCFFRDRIMFPIIDVRGDVVAFGGRILHGDGDGRKYVNSPDTPVYSKSRNLYALNLAKKTRAGRFILCEGNVDVIALHQAGFDSAVASCGTALTAEQARLLGKYTQEVVICYDADAAGEKATEKAIDILKSNGLGVRVLRLPPRRDAQGKVLHDSEGRPMKVDPDDFIRINGPEAFRSLLDKPQTDGQYRMGEIRQKYTDLSDDEQRIAYVKDAVRYIAGVASAVEREIYAHTAAREAGVSPESILTEANRSRKQRQRQQEKRLQQEALQPERLLQPKDWSLHYQDAGSAAAEQRLLSAVLGDRQLLEYAAARLSPEQFSSAFLAKLYAMALERLEQGLAPEPAAFMTELPPGELRQFSGILAAGERTRGDEKTVRDCIEKITYAATKREAAHDDAALLREAIRRKQEKEE